MPDSPFECEVIETYDGFVVQRVKDKRRLYTYPGDREWRFMTKKELNAEYDYWPLYRTRHKATAIKMAEMQEREMLAEYNRDVKRVQAARDRANFVEKRVWR